MKEYCGLEVKLPGILNTSTLDGIESSVSHSTRLSTGETAPKRLVDSAPFWSWCPAGNPYLVV